MNNKLTLLEAEAIDDLINAETEEQLLASSRSLKISGQCVLIGPYRYIYLVSEYLSIVLWQF